MGVKWDANGGGTRISFAVFPVRIADPWLSQAASLSFYLSSELTVHVLRRASTVHWENFHDKSVASICLKQVAPVLGLRAGLRAGLGARMCVDVRLASFSFRPGRYRCRRRATAPMEQPEKIPEKLAPVHRLHWVCYVALVPVFLFKKSPIRLLTS